MANGMIRIPAQRRRPQLERLADHLAAVIEHPAEDLRLPSR
jgi:hypothetical protein